MRLLLSTMAVLALCLAASAALAHGNETHKGGAYTGHAAALGEPGNPRAVTRTVPIAMTDQMRFKPDRIMVKRGETIRFSLKNTGELKHEMMLGTEAELTEHAKHMEEHPDMEHDDPNGVTVQPGRTGHLVWRFTKVGDFDFACLIPGHFQGGMRGKIVVR